MLQIISIRVLQGDSMGIPLPLLERAPPQQKVKFFVRTERGLLIHIQSLRPPTPLPKKTGSFNLPAFVTDLR